MFTYPTSLLIVAGLLFSFAKETAPAPNVIVPHDTPLVYERVLGVSEMGRQIVGYEVGVGDECLLFFGGIHGNERGTVELMEEFAQMVVMHPELVATNKKVVIIPLVNPDGYFDREDKLNARAVNLNRNFETDEWVMREGGEETFAGNEPFSERESLVIQQVVNDCNPSMMIAYHSQGALVSPEFNEGSIELARWYALQTGYEYFDEWDYAGTATRWFVETTDNAAITVELTTHEDGDWEINKSALLEVIAR